ncbi:MAG TPA: hypothetical protein VKY41_05525 [Xanthomarina sp.]|nr:hypothetical protein [Xanthomarina sp.]
MKTVKELLSEISNLLLRIKKEYPALYRHLDEDPITIPNVEHPEISTVELQKYLSILNNLIDKHKLSHIN